MDYFSFKKGSLHAEEVDINSLAEKYGTPLYVYSQRTFIEHFNKIKEAFSGIDPLICYSVKANSSLTILNELQKVGAGFDIVSGGELYRALKTGVDPKKIVYAGVGKTREEIEYGINSEILMFNVESINELEHINSVAKSMKRVVDIGIRVNPDVEADTHHYITTGKKENKFGIDLMFSKELFAASKKYKNISIKGVDMHIGSQITTVDPYVKAVEKIKILIKELNSTGAEISYFDIGGGLGIIYSDEAPSTAESFASKIRPLLSDMNVKIIIEPGRFIIGNAGILVARTLYVKKGGSKKFLITDAGMNDLIRPSLYQAYHTIVPVRQKNNARSEIYDIVGPICESADFLAKDREMQETSEGELIAVRSAGAYCMSMSSNYNSRRRAAEVLVKESEHFLIRERETLEDLVSKEKII